MTITIHPTEQLVVTSNGQLTRHWKGITDSGVPCDVFVALIRVPGEENNTIFERELRAVSPPDGEPIDIRRLP